MTCTVIGILGKCQQHHPWIDFEVTQRIAPNIGIKLNAVFGRRAPLQIQTAANILLLAFEIEIGNISPPIKEKARQVIIILG